jgi:hypothetical protein
LTQCSRRLPVAITEIDVFRSGQFIKKERLQGLFGIKEKVSVMDNLFNVISRKRGSGPSNIILFDQLNSDPCGS